MTESYFTRTGENTFDSNRHVIGAWNTAEQHVAPSFGLLVHAVERDHAQRHDVPLTLSRASFDIFGTYAVAPVEVNVRVLRPGRTIELMAATLSQEGRTAVVLRAWLMKEYDTATIAGSELPSMPSRDAMLQRRDPADTRFHKVWPGDAVQSIEVIAEEEHPGRARAWIRPKVEILDEPVSATARSIGMLDFANGLTPRVPIDAVAFPNLDLTASYTRRPSGEWQGYDTSVTFGATGIGLTHTVLHDEAGPFGVVTQSLTVRPMR